MEDKKEEGEAEIQEHGPEHWFSKWERQCLAEAEQEEALAPELQDEAAAQPEHKQQKLWHLFQNSATAVAQLYKDRVCQQPGLSLWVPFQNAATAVTNLYKESVDAHQRSFDVGIQIGYQRRNKDVLAWVKKRRRTIRREDLISFLCGKVPPPRNSRAPPRLTVVSPNRATSTETSSSVETDLQPFREAIALHGEQVSYCIATAFRSGGACPSPSWPEVVHKAGEWCWRYRERTEKPAGECIKQKSSFCWKEADVTQCNVAFQAEKILPGEFPEKKLPVLLAFGNCFRTERYRASGESR
uniref:CP072 protein n=1 Tax=Falco tinnunculus TaxID=100819 RepID=A0A8C4V1Y4_FALTI